jgi:GT2 family glycosyltransferase
MMDDNWFFSVHRIPENIGFGPAMNKGVEQARGEIVCLLSDDVRIYGEFISRVKSTLIAYPEGIVAADIVDWPAGWNQFGATPTFNYIQGYFMAMKKETFEYIEGFDGRFAPYDYEDVDLSYRAHKLNIPMMKVALPLQHLAAGTIGYSDDRMDHTCRMRALFAEKWGLPNIPERP